VATWGQLGFQDANRSIIEELRQLHDFINLILVFVITLVAVVIVTMSINLWVNKVFVDIQMLEWVWTLLPAILLLQIALPSLLLLYILDDAASSSLTVKTLGHQWYWRYEYRDIWADSEEKSLEFDSYMVSDTSVADSLFRLLDVDNRAAIPLHTQVRILISSVDVLHSWTVPSLGVKADAVPGRLNQVQFYAQRPGVYFGQCSEICGANHSFIPVVVEVLNMRGFLGWATASFDQG